MDVTQEESYKIVLTIECSKDNSYSDFVEKLRPTGVVEQYHLAQVPYPVLSFRENFIEHIGTHGLNSFLKGSIVMEDITSPSMPANEVEAVVRRFVETLLPATRIVIVDPYFYSPNSAADTDVYLTRVLGAKAAAIQEIFVVSQGNGSMKAKIHTALSTLAPGVIITDISTQLFHDRFWLNPDSETGIIMGTSLNGLGRRIALVDKLSMLDVQEVLTEVRKLAPNLVGKS